MQIETRKNTLPATEEGVDLSALLSMVVTNDDLQEKDEAWEFSKLKTEVYELVSKLNRFWSILIHLYVFFHYIFILN